MLLIVMDIYRFFHPHHNPRLHSKALRAQELSELEQAASEILKALVRAQERTHRKPVGQILSIHFKDIVKAMEFVQRSLETLSQVHPGDSIDDLSALVNERSAAPGWDGWSTLVNQQIIIEKEEEKKLVNG